MSELWQAIGRRPDRPALRTSKAGRVGPMAARNGLGLRGSSQCGLELGMTGLAVLLTVSSTAESSSTCGVCRTSGTTRRSTRRPSQATSPAVSRIRPRRNLDGGLWGSNGAGLGCVVTSTVISPLAVAATTASAGVGNKRSRGSGRCGGGRMTLASCFLAGAGAVDQPGPVPGLDADQRGHRQPRAVAGGDPHDWAWPRRAPGAALRRP